MSENTRDRLIKAAADAAGISVDAASKAVDAALSLLGDTDEDFIPIEQAGAKQLRFCLSSAERDPSFTDDVTASFVFGSMISAIRRGN